MAYTKRKGRISGKERERATEGKGAGVLSYVEMIPHGRYTVWRDLD
jgi:hypothetical protein